jgi:hypothetical protein
MGIIYGFLIGAACVGVFTVWQYTKYRQAIREVSDKWKAINDEWETRYHKLYNSWMSGIQPTAQQRMDWDMSRMLKKMNQMEYAPTEGDLNSSGLQEIVKSSSHYRSLTQAELDDVNRRMQGHREVISKSDPSA